MTEALPIGEGALGAMLFGLTTTERVQFNHDTLWTGTEKETGRYQAFDTRPRMTDFEWHLSIAPRASASRGQIVNILLRGL